MKSKAVVIRSYGGTEVLELALQEVPPPGSSDVQIRQKAIGLNFIDIYCRTGLYTRLLPASGPVTGTDARLLGDKGSSD